MMLSADEIEELCERSPGLEAWILPEPSGSPGDALASFTSALPRCSIQRRQAVRRRRGVSPAAVRSQENSTWLARTRRIKTKARAAGEAPRKLDRRDVLKGLSTVPALGLFGYAWQKQREYQQTKLEEVAATPAAAAGLQEINIALLGAGAQGQVLTDAMLRIPGLRFRAVCDIWTEYNQKRVVNSLKRFKHNPNALRGLPRDARQGERARRGDHRHARLLARAARDRLPESWQARVLREGDVEHARRRAQHGDGRPARPASCSRSATSAARIRGISTATTS